jgi:D-alanyl-D-alanine carboxypeptidase (penicillin-binding protein 5/6)
MRIAILSLLLPLFLCALTVSVSAPRAILINADTGAVLFEKKAHEQVPPASLTKIATALYAIEVGELDLKTPMTCNATSLITMPQEKKEDRNYEVPPYYLEPDGVSMGLTPHETQTFETLLYALFPGSANDAANVIAHAIGHGSITAYVEGMNAYLESLGCTATTFYNPHGLHYPGHVTTAYDVATMMRRLLEIDTLRQVAGSAVYSYNRKGNEARITHNARILREENPYYDRRVIAAKTGYIAKAGYCLAAAAEEKGRRLIAVLLGCKGKNDRYRDAIALFDAAFAEHPVTRILYTAGDMPFTQRSRSHTISARLSSDLALSYFPSEAPTLEKEVEWNDISLPLRAGTAVGTLRLFDTDGRVVIEAPLFAEEGISRTLGFFHIVAVIVSIAIVLVIAARYARIKRGNR